MTDKPVVSPYGSARDLPSIQEMERQIATLKLLRILLPKEQRNQLNELESEHKRIT